MILVVFLYLLFASTFTLGKAALAYVSPFLFIGIRMLLGGSLLLVYYWFFTQQKKSIKADDYLSFLHIIIFHIFCAYTFEFWALKYVTSSKACLLYNLSPFITALFYYFLCNEKITLRQVYGLIIGFLGFIPILIAQSSLEKIGLHIGFLSIYEVALIASVTSSAYGWLIVKNLINRQYPLILINGISMLGGGFLALIFSFISEGIPHIHEVPVTIPQLVDLFGLKGERLIMLSGYCGLLVIIANIIGYNLYGYLLSRYSPTFLSFAGFMTPLFAALLGWIFLNEHVTWHFFITMIMVIIGLYLFHDKKEIEFEEKGL
ncbi:MAG TPA: EamA family transporter [Candidatus Babeliales bacterium]|nr:EamA family transporter [Candidatus Babeliales bacterium]